MCDERGGQEAHVVNDDADCGDPVVMVVGGKRGSGMHAWFAAAADPRVAVAVCLLGVQVSKQPTWFRCCCC